MCASSRGGERSLLRGLFFAGGEEGALRGILPPKKIAAEEFMGSYVENTLQHLTLFVCFEREQSPASSR